MKVRLLVFNNLCLICLWFDFSLVTLYFPETGAGEVTFSFHTSSFGNYRGFFLDYVQETCEFNQINSNISRRYLRSSLFSPKYPPNYIAKTKMEENVEAKVHKPSLKHTLTSLSSNVQASDSIYVTNLTKPSIYWWHSSLMITLFSS